MRANNKNFIIAKDLIIKSFPFTCEAFDYIFYSNKKLKVGSVYKIDTDTKDLIAKIFSGKDSNSLQKGDKVYLMPNSSIGKKEFKVYLNSIKATIVDDISKATIVAGTTYESESSCIQSNSSNVLLQSDTCYNYTGEDKGNDFSQIECELSDNLILSYKAYKQIGYIAELYGIDSTQSFITSEGLNIIYNILFRKLKVLSETYLQENVNSGIKLADYDVYRNIDQMLFSNNINDVESGMNILMTCDLKDSEYHLWKLTRNHNKITQGYTKIKTAFRSKPEYITVINESTSEILTILKDTSKLTQDILDDLLTKIINTQKIAIKNSLLDNYFTDVGQDLEINIQLKDCWKLKIKENEKENESGQINNFVDN